MKLNNLIKVGFILGIPAIGLVSCTSSGNNPGIEYAPQMYVSDAYEPFSQDKKYDYNPNGMTMRLPVNGTVARGQSIFSYPNSNDADGYAASANYMSWVSPSKSNVEQGEVLYNTYCWHCHGKKGKNDGPIFKDKKMPAPAWQGYQSDYIKELPNGKAYHTITYGKGLMGPHSFLLTPDERWKVIHYVKALAHGDDFEYAPESTSDAHLENRANYSSYGIVNHNGDDKNNHSNSDQDNGTTAHTFPGSDADKSMIMSVMSKVEFKGLPNRKEIKSASYASLDVVAEYMKSHEDFKAVVIGHTDLTPTDEGAENLGMDRANSVKAYLISKGVNPSSISAKADTDTTMEGDVTSTEDRQANRRVEIEIYK